jgi:hypothetical protein
MCKLWDESFEPSQYLSNTNESATVRKILTSHNLNKAEDG